jgi:ribosomal protein S18 acetylase RimI-like enzyme
MEDQIFAVKREPPAVWSLRGARPEDRQFLFELNRATMRDYVDATWGWDDDEQAAFFDEHFDPTRCQILQVGRVDIGVLAVEERAEEIYLAEIQLLPEWQGRGIGSSVIESLVEHGAASDKPVTLRVLRTNPRASTLYTRLGFGPFREIETHIYLRREPSQAGSREWPGLEGDS